MEFAKGAGAGEHIHERNQGQEQGYAFMWVKVQDSFRRLRSCRLGRSGDRRQASDERAAHMRTGRRRRG